MGTVIGEIALGFRRGSSPSMVDEGFWRGRRVLVTGHTGFKGAWLVTWLHALGAEVSGLAPEPPTDPSLFALARVDQLCESHPVDVLDADAVDRVVARARPEVVFHLAAQSLVRRSFREPVETYAVNVMGTVNVCEAVRLNGGAVLVSVTSDKCYENREWEWGYRETEALGGHDPYSSSKACQELATAAYRRSYDLPFATARAGNVIGGGDWGEDRLVADVMRGALAGEPIAIRRPDAIRPWQHVLNPLSGYLVLAQAIADDPSVAGPFNFGPADDDARPVRWIVDRLGERWPEPLDWRLDEGPHPHEAGSLKVDSSRARSRLGWRPSWDLGEALDAIVDWYVALRAGHDMRAKTRAQIESFAANVHQAGL
jgi:CDP-glucose 4,6-dehydratase